MMTKYRMLKRFKGDPVFAFVHPNGRFLGFGFFCECWIYDFGLWPSEQEARANLLDYVEIEFDVNPYERKTPYL